MSRIQIVRRITAEETGISKRTFSRHNFSLEELRQLVEICRNRKLVSARQLSEITGISTSTIYRWIDEGLLEAFKIVGIVRIPLDQKMPVSRIAQNS